MRPSPSSTSRNPRRNPRARTGCRETSAAATREGGRGRQDGFHGAARVDFGEDESRSFGAGLRYGKPPKNTDAYRYVDRVPRRRADRFIWIAVIAALLAVAAIAFGLWRDAREKQAENEYIELPQAAELPSAASQPEQPE